MDLHVEVPSVEFEAMRRTEKPESSAEIKKRVNAARARQAERFAGTGVPCNAQMAPAMVGDFCRLDDAGERILKAAFDRMGLTARSHDRILRVARTIAESSLSCRKISTKSFLPPLLQPVSHGHSAWDATSVDVHSSSRTAPYTTKNLANILTTLA